MSSEAPSASAPGRRDVIVRAEPDRFAAAVVEGLDADRDGGDAAVAAWLRDLLWDHAVVCLRQPAKLTDEQHRAIVAMIGPVKDPVGADDDGTPVRYGDPKQIIDSGFVLTDELREVLDGSLGGDDLRPGLFEFFHTDDSYVARPAAATVLHARALPSGPGGATSFLDIRAAYRMLDPSEQRELIGLHAVHHHNNHDAFPPRRSASGPLDRMAAVSHPVVRAHPVTGVPALYFDLDRATHVEGLPEVDGRRLLQSLQDRAERDAPRYDHAWQDHDVLIWDNAAVQHRAGGDFAVGEPRRFWRFMVDGPEPVAARSA